MASPVKPKTVVAPEQAVNLAPAPAAAETEAARPAKVAAFWKGFNPKEILVFPDGTTHVFGTERFVTSDARLIKNIQSVMEKYNILSAD